MCNWDPFLPTIFPSQFKGNGFFCNELIASIFIHDNFVVMACAKYNNDIITRNWITVLQICHEIGIAIENSLMKCITGPFGVEVDIFWRRNVTIVAIDALAPDDVTPSAAMILTIANRYILFPLIDQVNHMPCFIRGMIWGENTYLCLLT